MTPRVTVLLPVHRGADHVGGAVESVLAQTFSDFELLVVDDASPDDSAAIVESYRDPRIRLLRNEHNLGQTASLNRGLAEAAGAYVARLDQDDRCLPHRLERQVAVLDAEPAVALVSGWMRIVDDDGNQLGLLRGHLDDYVDYVFGCLIGRLEIGHPAATFRRDAVTALGGYDPDARLAEDKDLWRRLALARHDARIVREPLVVYLAHTGSQSRRSADLQRENDVRSTERFLAALSPDAPVRELRLLLAADEELWQHVRTRSDVYETLAALDALLADAVVRLRLSEDQRRKLRSLVEARLRFAARRSWRAGVLVHWFTAVPLYRASKPPPLASVGAAAVYVLAPLLRLAHAAKWRLLDPIGAEGRLERPKRLARRFPALVAAYARLRGRP